jgi:hypothetical protein
MFDTLEYAEELKAAGVPEGQARVQARALSRLTEEKLSTKDDLAILKTDLAHLEERIRSEFKQEISEARAEFKQETAVLRWMIGFSLGLSLLILGKLFVLHP